MEMNNFNENLLGQVVHLRRLSEVVGVTNRIENQLEALRYVRNNTLGIDFEEGLIQENEWMM